MAFKMKGSPMKKNFGIQGLSSSEKKNFFTKAKKKAKQQFKKHGAKSGHGKMVDGKIVKASKVSKKPIGRLKGIAKTFGVKQALKRVGPVGAVLTAYDIAKTAKKAIPGLKRRAKSGNVNIGRKI